MNLTDLSIILLILGSGVLSYFNGIIRELFSFLSWSISLMIALIFLGGLASLLTILIPTLPDLRITVALISLFFTSFILLEWLSYLILNSIGRTRITIPERILAIFFGISRGCVIVTLLIILAGLTHLPTTKNWWQQSTLIHHFKPLVVEIRRHLPDEIAIKFKFEP
ncbi:MAG: CvpA family protein [Pseudomonadota bacterium]